MAYAIQEDIYGHKKRLSFFKQHLPKKGKILEFGCGTGAKITIPLALEGYNIKGIDLNEEGIEYGHNIIKEQELELPFNTLQAIDVNNEPDHYYDVIIASEVLEHIKETSPILKILHQKLRPGGILLITVPNGYGWFELEDFLWKKLKFGCFFKKTKLLNFFNSARWHLYKHLRNHVKNHKEYISSIDNSPHVQRFTKKNLTKILEDHSFKVIQFTGSVLFAGLISNMIWSGNRPIMKLNNRAGDAFPPLASGFFIAAKRQQ